MLAVGLRHVFKGIKTEDLSTCIEEHKMIEGCCVS